MSSKFYSPREIAIIRYNVDNIEKSLGYRLPTGIINFDELSDHSMTPGEIAAICYNVERVYKRDRRGNCSRTDPTPKLLRGILGLAIAAFILISIIIELF